ncbi:hypothetical protein Pla22_03090 [Rubripirellula amarantea]|uniref:Uncharacterized protein n=1 Tax=Rubripirellula amarantea TaxID=2527999 RepID=A0A5C5WRL6_9BACT|nr:hypothetical protein [Rubripirellula amarantea]TWT52683.1 hypothetical protein Pla22_03090 [Rubripirellula amarantea]
MFYTKMVDGFDHAVAMVSGPRTNCVVVAADEAFWCDLVFALFELSFGCGVVVVCIDSLCSVPEELPVTVRTLDGDDYCVAQEFAPGEIARSVLLSGLAINVD